MSKTSKPPGPSSSSPSLALQALLELARSPQPDSKPRQQNRASSAVAFDPRNLQPDPSQEAKLRAEAAELARLLDEEARQDPEGCLDTLRSAVKALTRKRGFSNAAVGEALFKIAIEYESYDKAYSQRRSPGGPKPAVRAPARRSGSARHVSSPAAEGDSEALPPPAIAPKRWSQRNKKPRENPAAFTRRLYTPYFGGGLNLRTLGKLDPQLYRALSVWVTRHPKDAIPELARRKDETLAQIAQLSAMLTEEEATALRRALAAQQRLKK